MGQRRLSTWRRDEPTLVADFEGIAIHCARGSPRCAGGHPDVLTDEPGGYSGFNALFGNKFVAPAITGGETGVLDLNGTVIADSHGNPGFPGFSPSPAQSLGYVAQMLEAGVPVVYGYIEDAHDNHTVPSDPDGTFGPGEAGYVSQLKAYDAAFAAFFARLLRTGSPLRTLFIVTADETTTLPVPRPRRRIATGLVFRAFIRSRARSKSPSFIECGAAGYDSFNYDSMTRRVSGSTTTGGDRRTR